MTWWCSAQSVAWTWSWQAYPGVWLFVLAIVGAYVWMAIRRRPPGGHPPSRSRLISFACGVLALWLAADWPLGALGAGYLASVHMLQYLLFALIAPPLLLHAAPPWMLRVMLRPRWAFAAARRLSRPLIAFTIFNTVLLGTHLPAVVDVLKTTQAGSFAMDVLWLFSGLVFWWPVLGPLPELDPLSYPGRLAYLVMNIFLPTVPASFLTFADYPIYALYELAPPVGGLSATVDQQIAGLTMKVIGGFIIFGTASVLFFKWFREEEELETAPFNR